MLEEVSRQSGVNIICTTGSWLVPPREFVSAEPDMIAPLYVREVNEGIEGTGIKAGVIKLSTDREGITERFEPVSRAVARAHKQTGVPILTHTLLTGARPAMTRYASSKRRALTWTASA